MKPLDKILKKLADEGFRKSEIRKPLLEYFYKSGCAISKIEIEKGLKNQKLVFNKTTLYRELNFLKVKNILRELQFKGERKKRYELADMSHHHHLICQTCNKIDTLSFNNHLKNEELKCLKDKGFKILSHSLEFFGLCSKCK